MCRFLTLLKDSKIIVASQEQTSQAARIIQLEAQHEADLLKISSMSKTQETYELRIEKERNHIVDQYKKILDQQAKQLEAANVARKTLEAQLSQLKNDRRIPRKGGGRFSQSHIASSDKPLHLAFDTPKRRGSRIPLPERPTTPLNPSPPHRPSVARETSSGNSTLQSSINSMYSRTTAATNGSNGSEKSFRSQTPESPVVEKVQLSPVLSHKDLHEDKSDTKSVTSIGESGNVKSAGKTAKTWAEMLRLPIEGQNAPVQPLPSSVRPHAKPPAYWRVSSAF